MLPDRAVPWRPAPRCSHQVFSFSAALSRRPVRSQRRRPRTTSSPAPASSWRCGLLAGGIALSARQRGVVRAAEAGETAAPGSRRRRHIRYAEDPGFLLSKTYQRYLLSTERLRPYWYKVSDSLLVAYGAFCFVTKVVNPAFSAKYHLQDLEDVINVSFFVKYMLLFWAHDFSMDWFWSGGALLDLVSCLPVLGVPGRIFVGGEVARLLNVLQLARFLRLLRDIVAPKGATPVPVYEQLGAVLVAIAGTVGVSAAVLYLYENPCTRNDEVISTGVIHSFEDSVLYMVNIFTGRGPSWTPERPEGKLVSAVATVLTFVFIPFLVAGLRGIIMPSVAMVTGQGNDPMQPMVPGAMAGGGSNIAPQEVVSRAAQTMARLDLLQGAGVISSAEGRELRRRCAILDTPLRVVDECYKGAPKRQYAERLRELLEDCPAPAPKGHGAPRQASRGAAEDDDIDLD